MPAAAQQSTSDLRTALGRPHAEADRLLADSDSSRLDVVAWLSAHVAAFEHAVYPVVKNRLSDGQALVNCNRDIVTPLTRTLRMLERQQSGDVLAGGLSADRLSERISELVAEHRKMLNRIVDGLERALDPAEMSHLARAYNEALTQAPTRPHPHLHTGLMFRLDALRDKILDTMDGRHVPLPRVRRPRITPGRWGAYLLGQPHEPPAEPRDPRASA